MWPLTCSAGEICAYAAAAWATAAGAGLLYFGWKALSWLCGALLHPLDYRPTSGHLLEKAATKRGLVTRNLHRGSAARHDTAASHDTAKPHDGHPNGWFFIDESAALERGGVRHACLLGLELAVFRDDRGEVHAVDAYCPHIGANMAVGGRVSGDCLECPFHGWQFRGSDGKCQHIPGAKRIPDLAQVRSWLVLEKNGAIFLWHHADDKEPDWYPEDLEDYATSEFTQKCGRTDHIVYSYIQDIPENGADLGHFEEVHKPIVSLGSDVRQVSKHLFSGKAISSMLWHNWQVLSTWRPLAAPDGHVGVMAVAHSCFFGRFQIPFSYVTASVSQLGPGIVYLKLRNKLLGDLLLCQYVVPEESQKQRLVHVMYSRPGILRRIHGKLALMAECTMVERDIQIWNNKCYRPKPVFAATAADESLVKFRRWFSQFYSSTGTPIDGPRQPAATKANCLDW